jgi:hypothetical protein
MASRALLQTVDRAGILCRVVRRGRHFHCGLCRNHYDFEIQALSCVERCWKEVLGAEPVVPRKHAGRLEYRCRFCARDHDSRDKAEACAMECRSTRDDRLALLIEVIGMPLPPAPERRIKPRAAPVVPLKPRPKKKPVPAAKAPEAKTTTDKSKDPAYADVK